MKDKEKTMKVLCRSCKNPTQHRILHSVNTHSDDKESEIWVDTTYKTIQCCGCETVSLLEEYFCSEDYNPRTGEPELQMSVYPHFSYKDKEPLKELYYLPNKIKSAYKETVHAYNKSLRILTGIGLRTVVEALCQDQGITSGNLKKKIDKLVEKDLMTKGQAKLLHLNRYLGNISAHEIVEPKEENLHIGIEIIETTLQNAYILPEKIKLIKSS